MKLSIIMPVYNEGNTLVEITERIKKISLEKEIIIIDDGSNDSTPELLKVIANKNENIKIFRHDHNKGKGTAIRTGLKHISGDIVLIQDADLEYDPDDYVKLIQPILKGKASVVYGSRISKNNKKSYLRYYLGGRFLSFLTNLLYRAHITDEPTCYKVFKSSIFKDINLKCKGFEFCPEITARVLKKGYKIHEVPISYNPRSLEEGKKIGWSDGLKAIYFLFKYRFMD